MIKIAFFEDHPIVINSLKQLLEKEFELVFWASTKADLYQKLILNNTITILIVDLLANDVRGLEVFEYLHHNYPTIKTIAFTSISSPILVENLLNLGVKAYVNKNQEIDEVLEAVNCVSNNQIYLPPDYNFLLKNYRPNEKTILSTREVEIIQLIAKEYTTQDIATFLNISTFTVENHRKKIFFKLDVKNVAGMVREAIKLGYA